MVTNVDPALPRGRGGWSAFRGKFTREFLLEKGPSTISEIYGEYYDRVDGIGVTTFSEQEHPWRVSTVKSFSIYIRMCGRLGLVEKTQETRPPIRDEAFLSEQGVWEITPLGQDEDGGLWINVQKNLYPIDPGKRKEYGASARQRKKQRRQRFEDLGVRRPKPSRRRAPVESAPAPPPEEVPEPTPAPEEPPPTEGISGLDTLDAVFSFVAAVGVANQNQAREIVDILSNLEVEGFILEAVRRASETPDWDGTASERRDARTEFQGVVRSTARLLELRGE